VLIGFGLPACKQGQKATMGQNVSALAGEWTLESIEGGDVAKLLPAGARRPSINIASDGKVSGFGGVNRLSSTLDVQAVPKGEFKLGPMISTRMAGPKESMDLENRFTRLLEQAGSFELSGDKLTVWNAQKGPPMRFVRGVGG
jgi:heat shock protein HslJ